MNRYIIPTIIISVIYLIIFLVKRDPKCPQCGSRDVIEWKWKSVCKKCGAKY